MVAFSHENPSPHVAELHAEEGGRAELYHFLLGEHTPRTAFCVQNVPSYWTEPDLIPGATRTHHA